MPRPCPGVGSSRGVRSAGTRLGGVVRPGSDRRNPEPGRLRLLDEFLVLLRSFRGEALGHAPAKPFHRGGGDPDRGGTAGFGDVVGDPFQLLFGRGVIGKRYQTVAQLGDTEPLQLAPDGDAGCRGLSGKLINEEHPILNCNHGYNLLPSLRNGPMKPRLPGGDDCGSA